MDDMGIGLIGFLMGAGFIASFIDSVVGGGGLISVPALMLTGLPPVVVLGTNKCASFMGSLTSSISFIRSGKMNLEIVKYLFPLSFGGSALGVYAVQLTPPDFLKPLVIIMLVLVTLYSVCRSEWGREATYSGMTRKKLFYGALIAFVFGFYDGFFGPGTGSFMLFGFLCIGFDFVGSAANARALNFASNIAAALFFSCLGLANYAYALPMGAGMIVGALCGTQMAIKKGSTYVRPLFIFMTVILIGKQIWEYFK